MFRRTIRRHGVATPYPAIVTGFLPPGRSPASGVGASPVLGAEPASGVVSRYLTSKTRSVNFQPSPVRW